MVSMARLIETMRRSPKNVRFADLAKVCETYFGPPRRRGTSHHVYATPWQGDPRVNIQNDHGMAKSCQVRQVLMAIDRLKEDDDG